jgi:hypothetical protein
MRRYWIQNNPVDFQNLLTKFLDRLRDRGHMLHSITPILEHVAARLDSNKIYSQQHPPKKATCFTSIANTILAPHLNLD